MKSELVPEVLAILIENMEGGNACSILGKIRHSGASDRVGFGPAI
jgi:hypothetical protein